MQIHTRLPYLEPFTDFVSEHRFRIVMAVCLVAIAIMVGVIHVTIGLGPIWAVRAGL
ncbi:hypothetical protein [Falsiroseomonas oryziterrae]|uniref:hypothetical protein n=1 Tax=Falsiroseomonas oryziterrae TaxID=2911368 RepID=UPI001F3E930E|nr:hypothetical protein [Roseomonas sp. NPKOSM-4]